MDEPLQKSLERYDVLERIAVGGMAEVFLAKAYGAHGFEKTIAIKRILPELARDPEFEARFIAEAKVAVRLSHANVVQVLDFGRIGESLFIAMEFVDGLDLAAFLRKFKDEGRLVPLPAAFHIAIEIIRALDFAHGHNVVHRDVSPSNILISRAGEVKIADFGIAVAAQPIVDDKGKPKGPRRVMGKWRYMSPEQTRGDSLDTRSDLFSAASVIYELFTGEKLFPGDESDEIIKNIESMPIPRLSSLRPGLPSRLDEVLGVALSRKPIDRPTRPASVLRSLIELSYESSIMATALDVAEAVASVMPARRQSGRGAIDDVIRKQMNDQSVARQTAVTDGKPPSTETAERKGEHSTGLFRRIDRDGLSRLEVDPTAVAAPRARRNSDQGYAMPGDDTPDRDPPLDLDRRTEVGGPPTGQMPKADPEEDSAPVRVVTGTGKSVTADVGPPPRRAWPLALALVVAAGGVGGFFALRERASDEPREVRVPVAPDAAPAPTEQLGTLEVDSIPPGATVTIADQIQGPAPRSTRVPANRPVRVKLELAGYEPYEGDYQVKPNTIVIVREKLVAAPAELAVDSVPTGAQVSLGGAVIGTTPMKQPVPAQAQAELVLTKPGFEPLRITVDLVAGQPTTVTKELKAAPKFGTVTFDVSGAALWATVSVKGKNLGRSRTASGLIAYKLPAGKHVVKLVAGNGATKTVSVTVSEGAQTVRVTFD